MFIHSYYILYLSVAVPPVQSCTKLNYTLVAKVTLLTFFTSSLLRCLSSLYSRMQGTEISKHRAGETVCYRVALVAQNHCKMRP